MTASLDFVQDICLNVVRLLVRKNELKLGIYMLEHCAGLFERNPTKQHQYHLFSAFSNVVGPDESQSAYYFHQLSEYYATRLGQVRGPQARSTLQALRWHHRIIRDSKPTAAAEDIDAIVAAYTSLLHSAASDPGVTQEVTMCIKNEMLSIQHYRGTYDDDYRTALEDFVSKQPCEPGGQAFESWHKTHQSAFLRYQERIFDYHRQAKDSFNALAAGRCALEVEGYKTERWVQFSLRFENWLRSERLTLECDYYRRKRLGAEYYMELKGEFCGTEELI